MKLDTNTVTSGNLKYTEYVCTAFSKEFQPILDAVRAEITRLSKELTTLQDQTLGILRARSQVFERLSWEHMKDREREYETARYAWRDLPWWKKLYIAPPKMDWRPPVFPEKQALDDAIKLGNELNCRMREAHSVVESICEAIKEKKTQVVWVTNEIIPIAFEATKELHDK